MIELEEPEEGQVARQDLQQPSKSDLRLALSSAIRWIELAHEATGRCGVSGGYDLNCGWLPPYAETSGYIVPTLLRAADMLGRPDLVVRGTEICRWLLTIQRPDGSFPSEIGMEGEPVVFDVGQIILGLLALWRKNKADSLLAATDRATNWLLNKQDSDGAWRRSVFRDYANTYSTRVSWALAEAWQATGKEAYRESALRGLRWALSQSRPEGWISRMAFQADEMPTTHTIAYTLEGFLRSADLLGDEIGEACQEVAMAAALRMANIQTPLYPLLPGEIAEPFEPASLYACLTGDAQMIIVWLDTARRIDSSLAAGRAADAIPRLLTAQISQPIQPEITGALPGSWPLAGGYEPLRFPNWATKFLADALLDAM